jgi:hypothetical protein
MPSASPASSVKIAKKKNGRSGTGALFCALPKRVTCSHTAPVACGAPTAHQPSVTSDATATPQATTTPTRRPHTPNRPLRRTRGP